MSLAPLIRQQQEEKMKRYSTPRQWLRKRLVWCTIIEQACGEPLYWYQRLFRWIGWP